MNEVLLETEGFYVSFKYVSSIYEDETNKAFDSSLFDLSLILEIDKLKIPNSKENINLSCRISMFHFDIKDMIIYFQEHIRNLRINSNYDSITFITYDLTYQLDAFCGELDCDNDEDNYFSLQFLIKLGKNNSTYVGAKSAIKLNKANKFIFELEELLNKVRR